MAKMKQFLILTIIIFASQFPYAQACGIYRIEYSGKVNCKNKENIMISLPTTMYLHDSKMETSEAFYLVSHHNGLFKMEIRSHLTSPIKNSYDLLSLYKKQSETFKMKVSYIENGKTVEKIIPIAWSEIEVIEIEDKEFGKLFTFSFKEIVI